MTESSYLWTTSSAGDGAATYTRSDLSNAMKVIGACMDDEGVAAGLLNLLAPTTTGVNNAHIDTGGGLVDGKPYYNSAAVDVTIPSASGGGNTRIDRVVLRADWTAQTVRITRIAGTDAASPTAPAITQNSGTIYDIKLAQALVNTAGTVTITDERVFAVPGSALTALSLLGRSANSVGALALISTTAGTGHALRESGNALGFGPVSSSGIANDSIDDTKAGNRVPQFYRRQGGDASDWSFSGTTNYTPTSVRMQAGIVTAGVGGTVTVTFPAAFSNKPLVFCSCGEAAGTVFPSIITTSGFVINSSVGAVSINWLAIGPE